jgi:DNA-binding transcriptional LysR family regulator
VLDLNDFRFFVEVVDRNGFSAAGRALDRPTSTISYRIQQLERELGLTLLQRTSRRVSMTPAGEEFYDHATAMLERASEAEQAMRDRATHSTGVVRYTVAAAVAQFAMSDMIVDFLVQHPTVELVQHAGDEPVDIISEGYDFAIRAHAGLLPDSTLIQRPLAEVTFQIFAAPHYLDRLGRPTSPDDLARYDTLFMRRDNVSPIWRLKREGGKGDIVQMALRPLMTGACVVTLKRAAEAGLGLIALPGVCCRDELADGRLERVLPGWIAGESTVTALMSNRRGISGAARAFLDHLAHHFPHAVSLEFSRQSTADARHPLRVVPSA